MYFGSCSICTLQSGSAWQSDCVVFREEKSRFAPVTPPSLLVLLSSCPSSFASLPSICNSGWQKERRSWPRATSSSYVPASSTREHCELPGLFAMMITLSHILGRESSFVTKIVAAFCFRSRFTTLSKTMLPTEASRAASTSSKMTTPALSSYNALASATRAL